MRTLRLAAALAGVALAASPGACTYDYLQRTDKVAYSAGDAVKANLEAQTVNPTKASMYDKSGLGGDGNVIPEDGAETSESP